MFRIGDKVRWRDMEGTVIEGDTEKYPADEYVCVLVDNYPYRVLKDYHTFPKSEVIVLERAQVIEKVKIKRQCKW